MMNQRVENNGRIGSLTRECLSPHKCSALRARNLPCGKTLAGDMAKSLDNILFARRFEVVSAPRVDQELLADFNDSISFV